MRTGIGAVKENSQETENNQDEQLQSGWSGKTSRREQRLPKMWGMLWEARYRTLGAKGPRQKSPDRCLQGAFWNNPGFSLCSWMDNVFYRDEEDWRWRNTLGRKLKRPILGMLSSRCWQWETSIWKSSLPLSSRPSSRCLLLAEPELSQIQHF